jgi:hypothetical protein
MKTDQEKAKQLIGEEKYNLLLQHGFMPLEVDNINEFMRHEEQIKRLKAQLLLLEKPIRNVIH